MDIKESLKNSSYFHGLDDQGLQKIIDLGKKITFPESTSIATEDEEGSTVFYVLGGRVDISVSLPGSDESENIARIGEGEIVGEMILLGKRRRTANITARDEVTVLAWEQNDLFKLFESNTNLGYYIMRNLALNVADRLAATNQVLRNALSIPKNMIL